MDRPILHGLLKQSLISRFQVASTSLFGGIGTQEGIVLIGMFVSIQTINSPAEEIKFGLPSIDTLANGPGTCMRVYLRNDQGSAEERYD